MKEVFTKEEMRARYEEANEELCREASNYYERIGRGSEELVIKISV